MAEKAIFLDRDDTLVEDPGYINHPDQVKLLPGTAQALIELRKMGYKLIVVTNQSAVARGIVSEEILERIHQRLKSLLTQQGAYLDRIYYCPFHPDGVIPKYRKESELRKPQPGMFLKAAAEMDIDLARSWSIGNSYRDVTAGKKAGCRTILIDSPVKPAKKTPVDPIPDKKAVNIKEAVNIIKMYQRVPAAPFVTEHVEPLYEESHTTGDNSADAADTVLPQPQAQQSVADDVSSADFAQPIEPKISSGPAANYDKPQDAAPEIQDKPPQPRHSQPIPDNHEEPHTKMLTEILHYIKGKQRLEMYEDFSIIRMLAGVVQILVIFCVLLSIWIWLKPSGTITSVLVVIGYAIVFQLMAIAFYMMHNRK